MVESSLPLLYSRRRLVMVERTFLGCSVSYAHCLAEESLILFISRDSTQ
jgi:hypothetical protein